MASKRKVTVTLDGDVIESLEAAGNVSAQLNEAAQLLLEQRRRSDRLAALLDDLDATDGPLPSDPDEDERLERLLGGAA